MIFSSSIHLPKTFMNSLFLIDEKYSMCKYVTFSVSIPLLKDIWVLSSFWLLYGCYEHSRTCVLLYVRASSGYMPRSGIAGSSGNTISNFLRNCQTDSTTKAYTQQNWKIWMEWTILPGTRVKSGSEQSSKQSHNP